MKFNLTVLMIFALVLSGCAVRHDIKSDKLGRSYFPQSYASSVVDYPGVGEVKTVEVGESLIYKAKQTSIPAVLVEERVDLSTENLGKRFVISLRPGTYTLRGKDGNGSFYEVFAGGMEVDGKTVDQAEFGGVYIPRGSTSGTEIYVLSSGLKPLSYPCDGINVSPTTYTETNELSFKRELVYTGLARGSMSITYREYKNDFARPAFSQHLSYDLSEGTVIGFRGARFEILNATNLGLKYRVLKQLD